MKYLKFASYALMAAALVHSTHLWADGFSGNQLMQESVHWYQEPASVVSPAPGVTAKQGTLLVLQSGSSLYMEGDSTLHKYQIHANSLSGSAVVKTSAKEDLVKALKAGKVGPMELIVPVADFKSRESGLDGNAHKALKTEANPDIKFVLKDETLKAGTSEGTYAMTAKGELSIAGVTNPVTLSGNATLKGDKVELKGVQNLKMSDYKVVPPSISLLVTSITCKDEIAIHYDVIFAPAGEAHTGAKK